MTSYSNDPRSARAVPPGDGPGATFLLPPLAVILVGALMSVLLIGQTDALLPISMNGQETTSGLLNANDTAEQSTDISQVFTREVLAWSDEIERWADAKDLDANLVATVMQIESCGDPQALSGSGAMGLFQVMPYHFVGGENPFQPDTNAERGTGYLRRSLEQAGGEARLAFAGYNGGIGVIGWSESDWPSETVRYAYWGSGIYAEASSGATTSLRLQEWLNAGGASLCRQAADRLGIE